MKKITVLDRILYALYPKKSVQNFLEEANKVVNEFSCISSANNFEHLYSSTHNLVRGKRKNLNYRKLNLALNVLLALSSAVFVYILYRVFI